MRGSGYWRSYGIIADDEVNGILLLCERVRARQRMRMRMSRSRLKSRGRTAKNARSLAVTVTGDAAGRKLSAASCLHFGVIWYQLDLERLH